MVGSFVTGLEPVALSTKKGRQTVRGWSTGQRNRHTLEGVPTRPAINGAMRAAWRNAKAANKERLWGRFLLARLAAPLYRATKPVSFDKRSVAVLFYLSNSRRCNKELSANPNNGEAAV